MGRGRTITRTHCLGCGCKLTDKNRYKSVKSRCKDCHKGKVKSYDQTVPPAEPAKPRRLKYCRGCGSVIETGTHCNSCDPNAWDTFDSRQQLIRNYHKLGIEEHLPAALAEIDAARTRNGIRLQVYGPRRSRGWTSSLAGYSISARVYRRVRVSPKCQTTTC